MCCTPLATSTGADQTPLRNLEIQIAVTFIGLAAAQIPLHADRTDHHARHAPHLGFGARQDADIDIALLEDAVIGQQPLDIVQHLGEVIAEFENVFRQTGRQVLMLVILGVLMLPAVATLTPLFVLLNQVQLVLPVLGQFNLRNSLMGVGLAIISGLLPFAIWNLKGYLDTIPRDLEEAAWVDGASTNQTFWRIILPLALPALAVTAFLGFVSGWTEFYFSWMFLNKAEDQTLAMALYAMQGQFTTTPWSIFSAFAILFAVPPAVVYFFAQRYITSGLAVGAVKG